MIRKIVIVTILGIVLLSLGLFCTYWINTQPIWVSSDKMVDNNTLNEIPETNRQIINFIETNGAMLAPTYEGAVCTEFVIKVIEQFEQLSLSEKNIIRIITTLNLDSLITIDSPIITGVQAALAKEKKGVDITVYVDVKPGDFVQFWNVFNKKEYGHCGIVLEVKPNESITVYSSHPISNGYGIQKFMWPDKVYFTRLK